MNGNSCNQVNGRLLPAIVVGLILVTCLTPGYGQRSSRRSSSGQERAVEPNAVGQQDQWAKYDIILKRNIFSRLRVPVRRQEREEPRPAPVMPNPESYYLLKGVVQENGDFIAFVEDTQTSAVLRLRPGDPVARGAVKSLTLDGLEYELEGRTVTVAIGSDLEGGHGAVTTGQLLEWSQTAAPAAAPAQSGPSPAASADEAEILRKLMEQRRQQLGQ